MSPDAQLVLLGASIALVSCLLTLIVTVRLLRQRDVASSHGEDPQLAAWTSRYVQSMRETAGRREDGPNPPTPFPPGKGEVGAGPNPPTPFPPGKGETEKGPGA